MQKLRSLTASLFVKCAILLAVSTASVAAALLVMSLRSAVRIAEDGVRTRAGEVTGFVADEAYGAIKFGKTEPLAALFERALGSAKGAALGVVAVNREGTVLLQQGALDGDLAALAAQTLDTAEVAVARDGFAVAVPVRTDHDAAPIGAVAMVWSAAQVNAQAAHDRNRAMLAAGAIFLIALSASMAAIALIVNRPLSRLGTTMTAIAGGAYQTPVAVRGHDEIGRLGRSLDSLRGSLADAATATREAVMMGAGFKGSSAAMMMTDAGHRVLHVNPALAALVATHAAALPKGRAADALTGADFDLFRSLPKPARDRLTDADRLPAEAEVKLGEVHLSLRSNAVRNADGSLAGLVVEWQDVTEMMRTATILAALDGTQVRAEFGSDARLTTANAGFADSAGAAGPALVGRPLQQLISGEGGAALDLDALRADTALAGRFRLAAATGTALLDGSLTPVRGANGAVTGFVLIAVDVTVAQAAVATAEGRRIELETEQAQVVEALRVGLSRLSQGDLACGIAEGFPPAYESLRGDFNGAVERLHDTIDGLLELSGSIAGEAAGISGAAENLSRRTETQAATLEQTAAAVAQIAEMVRATADGARQADGFVHDARGTAASSSGVIQDAVVAMGEIEGSSDQISRIVGVIDDITFQTNLLALNAGVEAARAGDAGRGFAVVAAEVRALAQRSSAAAREIGTLIAASGEHVERGVGLVRRAGEALESIFKSIEALAAPVGAIAGSAEEQATRLQEITVAMRQLDRVTQENAAAFEETTAASLALTRGAEAMDAEMQRFRLADTGTDRGVAKGNEPARRVA